MKKITFLLSALVLSSAMIAQSLIPSWDLEKMQRDKEREAVEFYQQYYDKNHDAVAIPEVPTDAMYDLLFQFPPYDIGGTYAVATDGDYIYTARWNASLFHKLDFQGNLVEEFTIAGAGEIRDLAYDGQYFYGAPNSATIYKMDFVNKVLVGTISGPSAVRGIAYDEINDGFWVTNGWDPPVRLISHTGAVLQTLNTAASSFGGIGWENVTEGGPYLWGYCQSGATNNLLVKINMTTGATIETFELSQSVTIVDGIAGGMEITDKVYPGKWAFFGTSQNDCIWALELADAAPPDAPAAVTNLTATAGVNGALTATLNWNNPAVSVNGEPLTELTAIKIYRNDNLIHTINNPVIGGAATYTDNAVPAAGNVAYKLVAENNAGEGIPALVTVWVGPDVPAAPGDVLLVAQGNDGLITWTAPTGGLHGGYYSTAGLNYTVKRFPGSVTVASNITALEYLDNTVPGVGNYYYTVTAANDVGEGGTGTSNTALLGAEGLLIFEQFDSGMPAGWEVLGMGGGNWSIANTANAGGTAPELQFSWTPSFVGVSRFASPNINSGEYSALRLKFNQMLNDYTTFTGEFIAVDCSIDGGATWEQLWFHEASSSLNAQLTEVYFSVPQNTNFRIAFKFDGNSFNINYWYIDNVVVEPVMGNDLSAIAITGNVTPSVGEATNYTVKFQNSGADPVAGSAYTVKLFKEGGVLQNSVPGVDIAPAEIKTIVIPWTPVEAGSTYIYGYIDFPDDDVPGNNTTGHLNVAVQPEGVIAITIGEGTNMPTFRIPFDFYWRNSIAQTLYFADEIGLDAAVLTAIKYTNNFQTNLPNKEVKILVGETAQTNLAAGWIDPTGFTMVYDGVIDFPSGENTIMIPLTTPYEYSGGNLVVITNRVYEGTYHSSLDRFYCTDFPGSSRNRYVQSDATIYDPWQIIAGTTLSNWAPNTTLFFSAEGPEILPGDANGDGEVTIMDVIAILNYMLGQNPQPFVFENADVNGDGQITVIDVIETLNIILSDGKTLAPVNSSDANIYLNSNNITLQSDGTLAGLQFELTGIEKLNFVLNGYQFVSNVVNGKLIGVIFSFDNTPLPAGEITLFTFNETSGLKWGQVIGGNVNANEVQINKFQNNEFHLVVFPNPVKEVLNVQSNETINFIRLINQIGQVVEERVIDAKNYVINPSQANGDGGPKASYVINASNYALIPSQSNGDGGTKATYVYDASNYVINTSGLSKGVYILEVHTRNNVSVQKIVIE